MSTTAKHYIHKLGLEPHSEEWFAAELGTDEMRDWWKEKDYLDQKKETNFTEDKSKDEIINEII